MVWSLFSILNIVIHGTQTPKYKIVYVNHLPEYCPVMFERVLALVIEMNQIYPPEIRLIIVTKQPLKT